MRRERDLDEQRNSRVFEAVELIRRQRQQLNELLEQTRQEHREHLRRLQSTEAELRETSKRIDALEAAGQESLGRDSGIDAEALREHRQLLGQQQAGLAEQLLELTSAARRLQVVIRQSQLNVDYLLGESEEPPGDHLAETSQLRALDVQEEERQRLAREIHDGPVQVLVNAIFMLSSSLRFLERNPEKARADLERLEADLREGLAEVRYFIFDLRPTPLGNLGLAAILRQYVEGFQQRLGRRVDLVAPEEIQRLGPAKETAIFRIVQEALQNVRKHSGATRVRVTLRLENGQLVVSIQDNGRGFDPDTVSGVAGRHFGLQSMRERAEYVDGSIEMNSRPGRGTSVVLRVPVGESTELPT